MTHVFYPEASSGSCTAPLLLDIDLIKFKRRPSASSFALASYVNDRPELVETQLPLRVRLSALPCRGGEGLLRELFEPLGYAVEAKGSLLDAHFPEWGQSPYYEVELTATMPQKDVLAHLYVLVPVLDDEKHYYVGDEEIDKVMRGGGKWLRGHPLRDLVIERFLKHQRVLQQET